MRMADGRGLAMLSLIARLATPRRPPAARYWRSHSLAGKVKSQYQKRRCSTPRIWVRPFSKRKPTNRMRNSLPAADSFSRKPVRERSTTT
jgi:hypothetical protein